MIIYVTIILSLAILHATLATWMENPLSLSFSSKQAQYLSNISVMQMHYWVQTGIAVPSISTGKGRGSIRRWNFTDIVGLRALAMLRDEGVPLQRVRKLLPLLKTETGERGNLKALGRARLVILPDGDVALARSDRALLSLLKAPGQGLMAPVVMVGLRDILSDVEKRMQAISKEDKAMDANITTLKTAGIWIEDLAV